MMWSAERRLQCLSDVRYRASVRTADVSPITSEYLRPDLVELEEFLLSPYDTENTTLEFTFDRQPEDFQPSGKCKLVSGRSGAKTYLCTDDGQGNDRVIKKWEERMGAQQAFKKEEVAIKLHPTINEFFVNKLVKLWVDNNLTYKPDVVDVLGSRLTIVKKSPQVEVTFDSSEGQLKIAGKVQKKAITEEQFNQIFKRKMYTFESLSKAPSEYQDEIRAILEKTPLKFGVTAITCMNTSKITFEPLERAADEAPPEQTSRFHSWFRAAPTKPSGPVTVNDAAALLAIGMVSSDVFAHAMLRYIEVYRVLNNDLGFVHTDCKLNNIFTSGTPNEPHFQIADLDKAVVGLGTSLTIGPIDDSLLGNLKARRDSVGMKESPKLPKLTDGSDDPVSMQVDMAYLLGDIFYNSTNKEAFTNATVTVLLDTLGLPSDSDSVKRARDFHYGHRRYMMGGTMAYHDNFVLARKELVAPSSP